MDPRKISNDKLYQDLKSEIDKEKLYLLKNEAKIRAAVASKSYDEFRDIVAAAHLQPIKKQDRERRQRSWKTLTDGT